MEGIRHPFTRALYEKNPGGTIQVTTTDGRVGHYNPNGSWISGDRIDIDPHLCGWIAGPRAPHRLTS